MEETIVLSSEAAATLGSTTAGIIAPKQPCLATTLDSLGFAANLFWTISEVNWSDWETITEMSLGAAGYVSMMFTEGADCAM